MKSRIPHQILPKNSYQKLISMHIYIYVSLPDILFFLKSLIICMTVWNSNQLVFRSVWFQVLSAPYLYSTSADNIQVIEISWPYNLYLRVHLSILQNLCIPLFPWFCLCEWRLKWLLTALNPTQFVWKTQLIDSTAMHCTKHIWLVRKVVWSM